MTESSRAWYIGGVLFIIGLLAIQSFSLASHQSIVITDSGFSPQVIYGKQSETLQLTITNQGKLKHNFVTPDFYIFSRDLQPGEKITVEFILSKSGTFPFYSDAPGHIEAGLQGKIIVEP